MFKSNYFGLMFVSLVELCLSPVIIIYFFQKYPQHSHLSPYAYLDACVTYLDVALFYVLLSGPDHET